MVPDPKGRPPRPVGQPAALPPTPTTVGATAAIVMAAVIGVGSWTASQEGTRYHAYYDGAHIPTICEGHTAGVKITDTATPAQCDAFYRADMTAAMQQALRVTPALAQHPGALKAVGDLVFNGGIGHYTSSPMAAAFAKGSWVAGCNAFVGYLTLYKAPKPVAGHRCVTNAKGVLYCEAGGLVTRRQGEAKICLTGLVA